jgi:hypothetical protein|eukprot:g7237.t1
MHIDECTKFLEKARKSAKAKELLKFLNAADTGGDGVKLLCRKCPNEGPQKFAKAYFASPPHEMVVCHNRVKTIEQIEKSVIHEMIHAVDYVARDMNLLECKMLACSEIRAARGAECASEYLTKAELLLRNFDIFRGKSLMEECVQDQARRATETMFPETGRDTVDEMMGQCFADHTGFDVHVERQDSV